MFTITRANLIPAIALLALLMFNCSENNTVITSGTNYKIYEGYCRNPVWSASGDYIVFTGNGGICSIDTEGNDLKLLLKYEDFEGCKDLIPCDFSSDNYLMFVSAGDNFVNIYYIPPNGKDPVFITEGYYPTIYGNIDDYYNIAYYYPFNDTELNFSYDVYLTDVHQSEPKLFKGGIVYCPDISPDGKRLAYFRGEGNSVNIYVYNIETKEEKFICEVSNFGCTCLRWSPDGKWLAFNGGYTLDRKNFSKRVVWIVSSEGGEPTPLFDDPNYPYWCSPGVLSFSWSPDGKWIVYDMGTEGELWKVRVFE
jgi:Tol biopolymer transport system component